MTLEPGYELDKAVAEACGIAVQFIEHRGTKALVRVPIDGDRVLFRPSIDWNDAMLAAEKVGLFDEYSLSRYETGWSLEDFQSNGCSTFLMSHASGPVAICLAILALKGKPQ